MRRIDSPHLFCDVLQLVPGQPLPAGGLEGSALVGDQLGVAAGGLGEDGAAVHVSMVVPSLVIPHYLEGLAVLHNLGGQASQAHYPGEEERGAGEGKALSRRSAATPKHRRNPEKETPNRLKRRWAAAGMPRDNYVLTDLLDHQLRKSLSW